MVLGDIDERIYLAQGKLELNSGKQIESYLRISFDARKNLEIINSFYLKDDDVDSIIELLSSKTIQYVSFSGAVFHGGTISISKMGLDSGTLESISPEKGAVTKFELTLGSLIVILRHLGILGSIFNFLHNNYMVILRYITVSPIEIVYRKVTTKEKLISKWGLSNLEFGPRKLEATFVGSKASFKICLPSTKIIFEKANNYDLIINNLVKEGGSAVTSHAIIQRMGSPFEFNPLISNMCFLLSLATSNWVVQVYCDLFEDNELIQTTIFNTKRRDFINSRYLINIRNINDLKKYLEVTIPKYCEIVTDFPLNKVIDYVVSSIGNSVIQERFIIGYVALETLCSNAEEFAKKNGEKIGIKAIANMKELLRGLFVKYNKLFTDVELEEMANKIAYKKITIKDAQKYILSSFAVNYDDDTVEDLYEIRNRLFHGSDYEHTLLGMKTNELIDLISKTLLKMLDWNGSFISKQQGYTLLDMD